MSKKPDDTEKTQGAPPQHTAFTSDPHPTQAQARAKQLEDERRASPHDAGRRPESQPHDESAHRFDAANPPADGNPNAPNFPRNAAAPVSTNPHDPNDPRNAPGPVERIVPPVSVPDLQASGQQPESQKRQTEDQIQREGTRHRFAPHTPDEDREIVKTFRALKQAVEVKDPTTAVKYKAFQAAYHGPSRNLVDSLDAHAPETKAKVLAIENTLRAEISEEHWR